MSLQNESKLNQLLQDQPSGAIYLTKWLKEQGFSNQLLVRYKKSNWIESIGTGAFIRKGADVSWLKAVNALQRQAGLCVLYTLAVSGEPLRFLAISEKIKGISDKVLTQTLRSLEQDGLIIRHSSYSQVPPRVAYELTPLGRELVLATCPLWKWMSTCIAQFENARQTFATTKERASGQRVPSSTPTAMQLEMSFFD